MYYAHKVDAFSKYSLTPPLETPQRDNQPLAALFKTLFNSQWTNGVLDEMAFRAVTTGREVRRHFLIFLWENSVFIYHSSQKEFLFVDMPIQSDLFQYLNSKALNYHKRWENEGSLSPLQSIELCSQQQPASAPQPTARIAKHMARVRIRASNDPSVSSAY